MEVSLDAADHLSTLPVHSPTNFVQEVCCDHMQRLFMSCLWLQVGDMVRNQLSRYKERQTAALEWLVLPLVELYDVMHYCSRWMHG